VTVLAAEAITRSYGNLIAVDALSVEARAGTVLALIGPNGAGKTTTLAMLAGTVRPDSGRVLWNGEPASPELLRRRVGLAPQALEIWPRLTCGEQLRFLADLWSVPRAEAIRRTGRLLEQLGLGSRRDAQARTLSGGMQRRLNIALALVGDPEAVVLDEPGAGLDPQSRVLVRDLIAELSTDKVVIVSSHDLAEVERLADQVVIIDHGRTVAEGTEHDLRERHGLGQRVEFGTDADAAAVLVRTLHPLCSDVVEAPAGAGRAVVACTLPADGQTLTRALATVAAAGVPLRSVHTSEASLEDVFLQLTGRSLRE
jgi:ABC-2 type transport system ATP-binding protein